MCDFWQMGNLFLINRFVCRTFLKIANLSKFMLFPIAAGNESYFSRKSLRIVEELVTLSYYAKLCCIRLFRNILGNLGLKTHICLYIAAVYKRE